MSRLLDLLRQHRAEREAAEAIAAAAALDAVTDEDRKRALQSFLAKVKAAAGELSADVEQRLEALWDLSPSFGRDVIADLLAPQEELHR